MRRSSPPSILLLISSIAIANQWRSFAAANFHTEGGNFKLPSAQSAGVSHHESGQRAGVQQPNEQYYDVELANPNDLSNSRFSSLPLEYEELQQQQPADSALEGIVEQLNNQLRRESQGYDESQVNNDVEGIPSFEDMSQAVKSKSRAANQQLNAAHSNFRQREQEQTADEEANNEIKELRRLGNKFKELTQAKEEQESAPEMSGPTTTEEEDEQVSVEKPKKHHKQEADKPLAAPPKRGQSEYVEFIEPVHSMKLKNKEYLEKRLASDDDRHPRHSHHYRAFNLVSSSGNIVFIAFITLCCVFSVVGVVGGMYYYNHVRPKRDDPFDDFTRYSPAGPGRDKLKKGRAGSPNAFISGEKGDESLAYKAQLHHYQQTKQKIIGGQAGVGGDVDASDKSDDEGDLEHNFSVFECPGLAPTGDIEVQNPNFVESPHSAKKPPAIISSN